MADLLLDLNEEQRAAVTTTEGFVRVIAAAGSGKTRALSHRFAYLVNEMGILPENILCVTFTNKAANEMRQRIHNLTGDNDTGYICTFHSFCVSVLQEDGHAVQYPKNMLVLDNSDIDAMLKTVYEERGLSLRDMTFSRARDMIEMQKLVRKPEYYLDLIHFSPEILHQKYLEAVSVDDVIFYGYLYQQKKCFGLDYNDLIKFTLYIFESDEDIRLKWQQRMQYIMIDEFQDIDMPQYTLMETLCAYHKNLFIVGDPDQTIYTWRGADVRYLQEFDKHFPGTKTIYMTKNYRSTPQILSAVNSMIRRNVNRIPKDIQPTLPSGGSVLCHFAENSEAEAQWIGENIALLHETGVPYRDMTVLYRAHYITRPLEELFCKNEIPYTIYSGASFFDRKEVKDALSYLRMVVYKDDLSFSRIANEPKRNLGERRMAFLQEYAEAHHTTLYEALRLNLEEALFKNTKASKFVSLVEHFTAFDREQSVSELLTAILHESGYEAMLRTEGSQERLDNLAELKQSIHDFEVTCGEETTPEIYLSRVALFTNRDVEEAGDKVKLMTIHAAKGLEFPYVFLCALNEGILPSRKTKSQEAMEEERRLAFVAMTRAERRLYLSEAGGLGVNASPRYPSRFLLDIDKDLLEFTAPPKETLIADTREYIHSFDRSLQPASGRTDIFPEGTRVLHSIMGLGTVVGVNMEKSAYSIQFDEMATPRSISFKAKLLRA